MILVVEDYKDTLDVILFMLEFDGYKAVGFPTGGEALAHMKAHPAQLVILDFNLPDMDGFAVFREMKADPVLRTIPVLMFSANEFLREAALREGIHAFITKSTLDWVQVRKQIAALAGPGDNVERQQQMQQPQQKRIAGGLK